MSSDRPNDYLKQSHDMREKHVNFLLAASGACIAFAVTQTRAEKLTFMHIPLGLAVLSWALSFWFGCMFLRDRSSSLSLKGTHQQLAESDAPDPALLTLYKHAASNSEGSFATFYDDRASTGYIWQLRMFIFGAACFIGWHVWEMWFRSMPINP